MKQYLELLKEIQEKGTCKPPAREGMPGTQSLFGYQFRHDLSEGFPLLTTKKMFWKGIVVELLWFLRGDTNIKYLLENDVKIWNEDSYNYYVKLMKKHYPDQPHLIHTLDTFLMYSLNEVPCVNLRDYGYKYGDCGFQYGKVWRDWTNLKKKYTGQGSVHEPDTYYVNEPVDQIKNLIEGLKKNPESRRHIVTAIDPAHDTDLALYWCHAMFQFNCRPIGFAERSIMYDDKFPVQTNELKGEKEWDEAGIPKYYLDCQLYQRSADAVLGVPFNIASYALLTHIICKIVNMVPGEFIHTFGDVHIYDNHKEAVEEQLSRTPSELPKLHFADVENNVASIVISWDDILDPIKTELFCGAFILEDYNPQPSIKAELSTGLKK